jgi:hypothetical protein
MSSKDINTKSTAAAKRDIFSYLFAEWENLDRKSCMIRQEQLLKTSNIDQQDVMNKDMVCTQRASNKLISNLCIELYRLERKLRMILDDTLIDHAYKIKSKTNHEEMKCLSKKQVGGGDLNPKKRFRIDDLNKVMISPKRICFPHIKKWIMRQISKYLQHQEGLGLIPSIDFLDGCIHPKNICDCGLASANPPSISTICNGILGDMPFRKSYYSDQQVTLTMQEMYYPLYSSWTFTDIPSLFKNPSEAACWAISQFKCDGLGNVWESGEIPVFLRFFGRVLIHVTKVICVSSPTVSSHIEDCFFPGVRFHLPSKNHVLLDSNFIELCSETFCQCMNGFCSGPPDFLLSAHSIYIDKEHCSCQNMKLNTVMITYNHTLQQKLSSSTTKFI